MISLDVYLRQDLVGVLERHEQAQLSFRYGSLPGCSRRGSS